MSGKIKQAYIPGTQPAEAAEEPYSSSTTSAHSGVFAGRRPFVGFEREQATYARLKPELLTRGEGLFVVLVGQDVEGPLATFSDALRAGYRRFGLGPLFIKQVLAVEPVAETSRDL